MDNTINNKLKNRRNSLEYTYSPIHQILPKGAVFIGYLLRSVIAVVAVTGLLMFITDAFKFDIPNSTLFLISTISTAMFAVMCISVISALIVSGLIAVSVFIATLTIENFLGYITGSFQTLWNGMMTRLSNNGYQTLGIFNFYQGDLDISQSELLTLAITIIGCLLSLLFTLSIMRKTKLFPILISGTLICSFIFTYNISSSNTGFALILTALCAVIVLKFYDSVYITKNKSQTDNNKIKLLAVGGYAGFAALCLAMLLVFIPASNINKRWKEIDFINDKLEYARAVISSIIIGDTPNMSDLGFVGNMDTLNTRSTKAEERTFTGKTMMTVQTAFNTPIYLRSWIGSHYMNDSWYSAYKDEVAIYKTIFSLNFTPEEITYNFYNAVNPKFTNYNINSTSYGNHIEDGFITTSVDISNIKSTGNLLYVPAVMNPHVSLLKHGTREYEPYSSDWKQYYEGIITTSWFNFNKSYRTISFVPIYRNPDYEKRLNENITYYQISLQFIQHYGNDNISEKDKIEFLNIYKSIIDSYEIEYTEPTIFERFLDMDNVEKQNFIYNNITLPELYEHYVKDFYMDVPEDDFDEVLRPIVNKIQTNMRSNNITPSIHNTILAVVDYLSENYAYTLSPNQSYNEDSSALRVFLNEIKEGYCVQFATSATMILRSMGIPTRYVEGYVASGFKRNEDTNRNGIYITDVKDYAAHAWIEVYVDGVGWMQYEATPQYYNEMYELYEPLATRPNTGDLSSESMPDPIFEEIDLINTTSPKKNNDLLLKSIILIIAILLIITLGFIMFIWYRNSKKALQKRYDTINRAARSNLDENGIRILAKSLNDYIIQIYSINGCVPETGELPSEYARRISIAMNDREFDTIMTYITKEEFGNGVTREELKKLSQYLRQLWDTIYQKLNPLKRFWLRHVKRVI